MQSDKLINRGDSVHKLVFLHYFGGSAGSWQWVIPQLEDKFHCVALNLPGFGGTTALNEPSLVSMAQWVLKELALLDIYDFTLIGHSMGGKIALQMATMPSEMEIHQLILVAPSPPSFEPMPIIEKERMLHHPDTKEAAQTVENSIGKNLSEHKKNFAIETQLSADHTSWEWWLNEGKNHSIVEEVQGLEIPVTVISSDDDPVISMDVINEEVMPNIPKVQLVQTRDAGHLLPLEKPDWLAEQIRIIAKK